MLRSIRFALLALVAAAIALPAPALAAPSTWQTVDVTLQTEQQQSMLLVSGELPASAKLPAEAELAVPAGTELQWIGQILGGAASSDPELKYVKSTDQGMDLYRFTLTKSRTAQVEGVVQGMTVPDGANFTSAMKWTAWQALPEVRMSQRVPKASQILSAAPGASLQPGEGAYSYYTKTVKNPKAGQILELTFAYSPTGAAAGAAGAAATTPSSNPTALIIILAVFIGGFGFLLYKVRGKIQPHEISVKKSPQPQAKPAQSNVSKAASRSSQQIETEVAEPRPKAIKPAYIVVALVALVVVGAVFASGRGVSAKVTGGTIKKSFGAASPCTTASIPVMANQGVDLSSQGEKLLDAFMGQEGVGDVVLDLDRSVVDIKFCDSLQSEDSIRQILTGTGLVTTAAAPETASAPTTATLDPSGKKQSTSVDIAKGNFSPGEISLKAGVPTELTFGAAASCITEVNFKELGVKQDLTAGPATVKLPALEPGTYTFACPQEHQVGKLIVQ